MKTSAERCTAWVLLALFTAPIAPFGLSAQASVDIQSDFRQFDGDYSEEADLFYGPKDAPAMQVAWGAMTRPWTRNAVLKEFARPMRPQSGLERFTAASATASTAEKLALNVNSLPFSRLDGKNNDTRNPFLIMPGDFFTGTHLVPSNKVPGPVPSVASSETSWFAEQIQKGMAPDVFVIGGHHVISEGYHNDAETMFMYTPTLIDTIERVPAAREYFDHVKFAVLWGCNTLTDLEPHGPKGEYLSPEAIQTLYASGKSGRDQVIGSATKTNTLEFYRARLAREYGAWNKGHYEYTRGPEAEKCQSSPGNPYLRCSVTDVDRILPDRFLYDGSHKYNGGIVHKQIFRNAYLVLGFNSASPSEENRVKIFQATLDHAYAELNRGLSTNDPKYVHNLLREITADQTEASRRATLIRAVRKAWTEKTYAMNRGRPSGSITPALPELDRDGMFAAPVSKDAPMFAPYEQR